MLVSPVNRKRKRQEIVKKYAASPRLIVKGREPNIVGERLQNQIWTRNPSLESHTSKTAELNYNLRSMTAVRLTFSVDLHKS